MLPRNKGIPGIGITKYWAVLPALIFEMVGALQSDSTW